MIDSVENPLPLAVGSRVRVAHLASNVVVPDAVFLRHFSDPGIMGYESAAQLFTSQPNFIIDDLAIEKIDPENNYLTGALRSHPAAPEELTDLLKRLSESGRPLKLQLEVVLDRFNPPPGRKAEILEITAAVVAP